MAAVSRAFVETPDRIGQCLGIIPGDVSGIAPDGYPNPWVEIVIRTHLPARGSLGNDPMSRNHLNVLSAAVLIALPGASGTQSEIELAARYGKPLLIWSDENPLPGELKSDFGRAKTLAEVQQFVRAQLSRMNQESS